MIYTEAMPCDETQMKLYLCMMDGSVLVVNVVWGDTEVVSHRIDLNSSWTDKYKMEEAFIINIVNKITKIS